VGRRVQQLAWLAWLLFLVSSVFFLASAIVARDPWAITGSLLFGIGVVLFLVSLWGGRNA
jgi:uncharacterized membrane protein YtjA (UPF0391 family)